MFRSNSISWIGLALAFCAASPSWCFAEQNATSVPRREPFFSHPLWPTPKPTGVLSEQEQANPFDPIPDASERGELEAILATWDRTFAEKPFNERSFRRWDFNTVFGPSDPDQCKEFREGVLTHAPPERWSMRETRAVGQLPEPSKGSELKLFPNFFGNNTAASTERSTRPHLPTETTTWEQELFARWSSDRSSAPWFVPLEKGTHDPPLLPVLAFCGNGQARELPNHY